MRWLSNDIVNKLQGGLITPFAGEGELDQMELHGQLVGGRFEIQELIGTGGMGAVHRAFDRATGEIAVVKVLHPSVVADAGPGATLSVLKEAVALGRLNEQTPRTPHVVRLLDTGTLPFDRGDEHLALPWIAIEFVDGGALGTTLGDRVEIAKRETGAAFDRARAARALASLAEGLAAVHRASVVHRDIKPPNVLCTGAGEHEIWKLADFGIARPDGVAATFGGLVVGTPGYAPPELVLLAQPSIGPWTDVFGLAAVVYYFLTGAPYFPVRSVRDGIRLMRDPKRRSVLEEACVAPDLRSDLDACRAIDESLAAATRAVPAERTATAMAFAEPLLRVLRAGRVRAPEVARVRYTWIERQQPSIGLSIDHAAWDGDRCLAVTSHGLFAWEGRGFRPSQIPGTNQVPNVRFVRKLDGDRFLLGGAAATLGVASLRGGVEIVRGADPSVTFERFDGDLDDLAVIVGQREGNEPALFALVGRHWLKPLPVADAARIHAIARLDRTRWIVGGVGKGGEPFLGVYAPLAWEVTRVASGGGAVLACAGDAVRGIGFALTVEGWATAITGDASSSEVVAPGEALGAATIDDGGVAWAASTGRIFFRDERAWSVVCDEAGERSPFVSIHVEHGRVRAVTKSGRIVEGTPA